MMKPFFRSLPAALLILLFTYAACSKLAAFTEFRIQLHRQMFPGWMADALLYALPAAELLTVTLLLFHKTYLRGLISSLFLLCCFTLYIALVLLHYWGRVPCSCGGILGGMSWQAHLVFNGCFLALNLIAIYIHVKERGRSN